MSVKTERLKILNDSIYGVSREIRRRSKALQDMVRWLENPQKCKTLYTQEYITKNWNRFETDLHKLKIIKIQLVYMAGMTENS